MSAELMSKAQLAQALSSLPASCAFDAIENVKPAVSVHIAREVLLRLEAEQVVSWRREAPQTIALTDKGRRFLERLQA